MSDNELLTGLSVEELEALADGMLASSAQGRLDELLSRRADLSCNADEELELDRLLRRADQLTILRTRARYTLHRAKTEATGV